MMFGSGKKNDEDRKTSLEVPATFWPKPAVDYVIPRSELYLTTFSAVSLAINEDLPNLKADLTLSNDHFPDLERHGLIPEKSMHNSILNDRWKADRQIFEKMIIESNLQYYRIPYSNEDIAALQKRRREEEYENRSRSTKAETINFLFQLYNQLKKQIDWDRKASKPQGNFLPKLPRLPSDIVKLIASYFSFEDIIIKEMERLFRKTAIAAPAPMKSIFFKPVVREKLQKQPPLMLAEDGIIASSELVR